MAKKCLIPKWKAGQIVTIRVDGKLKRFRIAKSVFGHTCTTCIEENRHLCILGILRCCKQIGTCRYPKPLEPKSGMSQVAENITI